MSNNLFVVLPEDKHVMYAVSTKNDHSSTTGLKTYQDLSKLCYLQFTIYL